jgi:hypothetical protein
MNELTYNSQVYEEKAINALNRIKSLEEQLEKLSVASENNSDKSRTQ